MSKMKLNSTRQLHVDGSELSIVYSIFSSRLVVQSNDQVLLRRSIWLPYHCFSFTVNNQPLHLKVRSFPLTRFSLEANNKVLYANIFPRLRRKSILTWGLTPVRLVALLAAKILS